MPEHPYDPPNMEPSLAATLAVLRERDAAPSPNAEMIEAAERVSAPLAAFAHTLGFYLPGPDFGAFETDAQYSDSDLEDWVAALRGAGCDLSDYLLIGTDGGGEEFLFMSGDKSAAGYTLFRWDMTDDSVERFGTFADLFRYLAGRSDKALDPRLAAIAG